jgi:hypothetical protein
MSRARLVGGMALAVLLGCSGTGPSLGDGGVPDGGTAGDGARGDGAVGDGGALPDGGTPGDGAAGDATTGDAAGDDGPPPRVWGVTLDDVSALDDVVESLARLSRRPTARIVFDEFVPAADYVDAATAIHAVADVMGEILDSQYVDQYTVTTYRARTVEYLNALGDVVDIWEVGNEINGEWLGTTSDVVAKMTAAYEEVTARGKPTALTLYYNEDCWSDAANEVFTWAEAHVPAALKQGLDYVFFSYYEDDCNGLQPDWPTHFHHLATMFPNSRLGFGECGTTNAGAKATTVNRYYTMTISEPRYVGGYFWWYYAEDMVPYTKPLWTVLDQAIASQ